MFNCFSPIKVSAAIINLLEKMFNYILASTNSYGIELSSMKDIKIEQNIEIKSRSKLSEFSFVLFIAGIVMYWAPLICPVYLPDFHYQEILMGVGFFLGIVALIMSIVAIIIGKRIKKSAVLAVWVVWIQSIAFLLLVLLLFLIGFTFETTSDAYENLSKIHEIEEFVITYDQDDDGDGAASNDYEIYLTGGRFLIVHKLSPSMHGKLKALGNHEICIDGNDESEGLLFSDLGKLCGKKIKKLEDVIQNYDLIQDKILSDNHVGGKLSDIDFIVADLDRSKLHVTQKEFEEDFRKYDCIVSFEKTGTYQRYGRYYKYHFDMKDGSDFDMVLSTVKQKDEMWLCDFSIIAFNGKKLERELNDWSLNEKLNVGFRSYRDLFDHYDEVKKIIERLIS